MNAHETELLLNRIAQKVRLAEDCLQRALDQLEEDTPSEPAWRYVKDQVDKGHNFVIDANAALNARGFPKVI